MVKRIWIFVICVLCVPQIAYAAPASTVFARDGNIYYFCGMKEVIRLTASGKDRGPVLSQDGKKVVFLRKSDREAHGEHGDDSGSAILADQIWIVDIDGENAKILVRDRNPDDRGHDKWRGEDVIAHIEDDTLQFSPDGKRLYFISSAWVTAGALHSVNVDGTDERFIASANTLKVIGKGEYTGCVIVSQHRYFLTGGSYDWYYVFTPEGKEIGPLGDDLDAVDWEFLYAMHN